jgi:NADPH:quinone reductase-like Zn-dependent oxidoreductase
MKAVFYETYGDRTVMQLGERAAPAVKAHEVLVRVQAASINPVDGKVRRGELKLIAGGHFPKQPGLDFAGEVVSVGDGVTAFRVGDAVFGCAKSMSEGALAEFAVANVAAIAKRPQGLDVLTAAAVPVVAMGALQPLRDIVKVAPGDAVLVNGCTGGVGLFALQLAKRAGAHVTGVCGSEGVDLSREMGAEEVIDFRTSSALARGGRYRAILELSGRLTFGDAHPILDEHGIFVDFSPTPASLVGNTLANPFRTHKHVFAMTSGKTADLDEVGQLLVQGELKAPPLREFPLDQFRDAFALAESGKVMGKIVVRVASSA